MVKNAVRVAPMLVLLVLMGCTDSQAVYNSKVTAGPGKEAGQYEVSFTVEDVSTPDRPQTISAPKLVVVKGQEGRCSIENGKDAIVCTVLVEDVGGKPQARTKVVIQKDAAIVWQKEETLAVEP